MDHQLPTIEVSGSVPLTNTPTMRPTPVKHALLSRQSLWRLSSLDNMLQVEGEKTLSAQSSKLSLGSTVSDVTNDDEKKIETKPENHFRSTAAEIIFGLSMALTQLLAV